MRILLAAAITAAATPVLADETTGTVLAFDRKASVLVLEDKTVWSLPAELDMPEGLVAGEEIRIVFTSEGEDGHTVDGIARTDG